MARRGQAAALTRAAIVDAVHRLLDAPEAGQLTLDEVARAAGVTRATVYNQFGSRRALLTAAFADQGRLVRYDRVTAAAAIADPRQALRAVLREACRAWETKPQAIRRVLALATLDREIGEVAGHYEQARRAQMAALAARLDAPIGAREAAAVLGAVTHPLTYYQFRVGASARTTARRLADAALAALRWTAPSGRSDRSRRSRGDRRWRGGRTALRAGGT
jgi:AcrR family transcriptional regulator